jgi:nucleoside-diphosphate-sugar epimerase
MVMPDGCSDPLTVILGGSGYIGKHLVTELAGRADGRIRLLTRTLCSDLAHRAEFEHVELVEGDIRNLESLQRLLEPGCTVINLVYFWDAGQAENLAAIRTLIKACKSTKVGRLIHCSTAAVVGRAAGEVITEETTCRPVTDYGIVKLRMEQEIIEAARGIFDCTILRPTAVMGVDGAPLKKLATDLVTGSRLGNYMKSGLFGRRRMNLVHVANVAAAIRFLAHLPGKLDGEVFFVSEDDHPRNNFLDVECSLMKGLGVAPYSLPTLTLPSEVLHLLLMALRRNNVNPKCIYSPRKLLALGFERPMTFDTALAEYIDWYRVSYLEPLTGGHR